MNYQQYNYPYNKNKNESLFLSRLTKQLAGILILLLVLILLKYGNTSITNGLNTKFKAIISTDYTKETKAFIISKIPNIGDLINNYETKLTTSSQFKLEYLPVDGKITSDFGNRINPITKKIEFHQGVDINCKTGTNVRAIYDGIVKEANKSTTYGLEVVIDHQDGFISRYAHLSELKVKTGDEVLKGSVIGLSGSTGESTGPHLHFELDKNDTPVNPIAYLDNSR